MASQDKYEAYRDIIYYMAAQMDLTGGNTARAIRSLLNSIEASSNSPQQRSKAFLQLAEIAYENGQYKEAARFYDSLQVKDSSLVEFRQIEQRKKALQRLIPHIDVLQRQDSLWRIAGLPEEERKEWARKLLREFKKQQGLAEDPALGPRGGNPLQPITTNTLFMPGEAKGEWYFYNATSRNRGQTEFKNRWGNRPNSDNWRRLAALQAMMNSIAAGTGLDSASTAGKSGATPTDLESIYNQLPLSPEQQRLSRDSISTALYNAGKILIQDMEDCSRGVSLLERLLSSDTTFRPRQEVYINLFRCYQKQGDLQRADQLKGLLEREFPEDPLTLSLLGKNNLSNTFSNAADSIYQRIYLLFTDGNYPAALAQKKMADSVYGAGYWTPQLLYIESIYYIQRREDSIAVKLLNQLSTQFPNHPLKIKALALIEALSNRIGLEASLTIPSQTAEAPAVTASTVQSSSASTPTSGASTFVKNDQAPHLAVLVLTGVDPALVNETKNALLRFNRENFMANSLATTILPFSDATRFVQVATFTDATLANVYKERAQSRTRNDIAPWLEVSQFFWMIISVDNLERLNQQKDLGSYKDFLNRNSP
jgi:outer membrane protein assembly factor BamD (BamD/ComL family)